MNRTITLAVLGTLLAACDRNPVAPGSASSEENVLAVVSPGATYSGRATAIDATVLGVNKKFCDTGPLPSSGGSINHTVASAAIPGVLSTGLLKCQTSGANQVAATEAEVANLLLTVGGNRIYADVLASMARAACTNGTPTSNGHSSILRLNINGQGRQVTGAPNQRINLPNGYVVINEQSSSGNQFHAARTVTALRVVITGIVVPVADLAFSRSHADIDC